MANRRTAPERDVINQSLGVSGLLGALSGLIHMATTAVCSFLAQYRERA